ncbi:replication initiator [Actinocatenispora comari]|uniref:Replication initiation protein n=1 Tax=Actinocatenispora comari TaxID=2807577 RepID=A0A8J4ABH9_9ACTN|nr:replication initiator [Actinocatenispora comari]GIL25713.1 replication initiation protein [Actinocatenispora comari]
MTVTTLPIHEDTARSASVVAGLLSDFTGLSLDPDLLANGDARGLSDRITDPSFGAWLDQAAHVQGCTRPVRLSGSSTTIDRATGQVLSVFSSTTLPDGVLYAACKNRRATVCPACAHTYRYDTYHLIAAGLRGGKEVPETVTEHPAVFATFTAPGFGPVHSGPAHAGAAGYRCRPRHDRPRCPHGRRLWCTRMHAPGDPMVGTPFCLDCYDHDHQVVWNHLVPKLWDRTMTALRRQLGNTRTLRVRYAKVAEYQRRGVVHLHALFRLDGYDRDDPDSILPPPRDPSGRWLVDADDLAAALRTAAATTGLQAPSHPDRPDGWPIVWGDGGRGRHVDVRVVRRGLSDAQLTEQHVAGYIAKYATKGAEDAGINARRLRESTVGIWADRGTHVGRLVAACWRLGRPARSLRPDLAHPYSGLRHWAHMLGFGGHFSTKSRRYSTTLGALRAARRPENRVPTAGPTAIDPTQVDAEQHNTDTTLVINDWHFVGTGWLTTADEALARAAADAARSRRPVVVAASTAA